MVKAQDLISEQKKRENTKFNTYYKVYSNIEKKITIASASNYYYIWYEIPELILGTPGYKLGECIDYIKKKLTNDGFNVKFYEPNVILVEWFP
jgi:hypothetical protein